MKKNMEKLSYLQKSGGFTLLEIMMVAGIISIIAVIGSSVVTNNLRLYNQLTTNHEAFQNSRLAMSVIVDNLNNFTRIDLVSATSDCINGYATSDQSAPAFLKVLTNGDDSSYHIYFDGDILNGNLMLDNNLLATDLSQPLLTDGGDTIYIEVTPASGDQAAVYTGIRKHHYPDNVGSISKLP